MFKKHSMIKKLISFIWIPCCFNTPFVFDKQQNIVRDFSEAKLKIDNVFGSVESLINIPLFSYENFKNKTIPLFYHKLIKNEFIASFLKNVFIENLEYFIANSLLTNTTNQTPIYFANKIVYINDWQIKIGLDIKFGNDTYKIDKNTLLNNSLKINNDNLVMNLPVLKNNSNEIIQINFVNFKVCEIFTFFDYQIDFTKSDPANIMSDNLYNFFNIYSFLKPSDIVYTFNKETKCSLSIQKIKYELNNGIQKAVFEYTGKQIFNSKNIDISIKEKEAIKLSNILIFDNSFLNEWIDLGSTIRTIGYVSNIKKDFNNNCASIFIKLNELNKNLIFYDYLNLIKKDYEYNANFDKYNFFSLNIKDDVKENNLPSNILISDISIMTTANLTNINFLSKKIISYNNDNGSLKVSIEYSYKNYFNKIIFSNIDAEINGLLFFQFDKEKFLKIIESEYISNNELKLNELKNNFVNLDIFKSNGVNISNNTKIIYKNNKLDLSFYLTNKQNKILEKKEYLIDISYLLNKEYTNNNYNYLWIISILIIVLIVIIISIISYKKRKRK